MASLEIADKLPKYKAENKDDEETSFDENDECCICLEKDNLWKTNCNHIICKDCISKMKTKRCPMCRKNITKEINQLIGENNNIDYAQLSLQELSERLPFNMPLAYAN